MPFTSSLSSVVLRPTAKATDAAALQAGFDALTILDTNTKGRGLHVGRPAFAAHQVVHRSWNRKSMTL
jgi:hypothetical protein